MSEGAGTTMSRPKIVVLGAGLGGTIAAY